MSIIFFPHQAVAWPSERAKQRWQTIEQSSVYKTWAKANPVENKKVIDFWATEDAPVPMIATAFGRHLIEHAVDLKAVPA